MLNLAAGETISGIAGAATSITYTIAGMELNAGVEAYKVLAQGQLGASAGTLYTAPASTQSFVKSLHLVNATGADVSGIKLYKNGTGAINQITGSLTIPANGWATYEEDGWRVYNSSGERLMNGVTAASSSGGGTPTEVLTSYDFDGASTADADPGAGKFRWNATMTTSKETVVMYISTVDKNGKDMTAFFDNILAQLWSNAMLSFYSGAVNVATGRAAFRIDAVVTAVGYRKLTLVCLARFASNPLLANGTNVPITWSASRRDLPLPPETYIGRFNAGSSYGIPGFIPLRVKNKTLTSSRMYVVPFTLRQTVKMNGIRFLITTAATSGNWRGFILSRHHQYTDGMSDNGPIKMDTGVLTTLNSVGAKNGAFTAPGMLPPGYYFACLAIASFTGSLIVAALNGVFIEGSMVDPTSGVWNTISEHQEGGDFTGTGPLPGDTGNFININPVALNTGAISDQYDCPMVLDYETYF